MWIWLRLQRTFGRYFRAGLALYFRHIGLQRNEEVPVFQQQRRIADDSQEEGYQLGDFLNCISLFVKKVYEKQSSMWLETGSQRFPLELLSIDF